MLVGFDAAHMLVVCIGAVAAILPAFSAALVGFRSYAELEIIEQQSLRMERVMAEALDRIRAIDLSRSLASQDLAGATFELCSEMLWDVNGWIDLFYIKRLEAG